LHHSPLAGDAVAPTLGHLIPPLSASKQASLDAELARAETDAARDLKSPKHGSAKLSNFGTAKTAKSGMEQVSEGWQAAKQQLERAGGSLLKGRASVVVEEPDLADAAVIPIAKEQVSGAEHVRGFPPLCCS
jgi:hypothetical protein